MQTVQEGSNLVESCMLVHFPNTLFLVMTMQSNSQLFLMCIIKLNYFFNVYVITYVLLMVHLKIMIGMLIVVFISDFACIFETFCT